MASTRDTLIQHNGFSGQAIYEEPGKPERIVRIADWVGTFTFACALTSTRMEVHVERLDAHTRRVSSDGMAVEVSDAASGNAGGSNSSSGGGGGGSGEGSGHDTTGVGVWLSSLVMIPWIRGPGAASVEGKRVLEVGSGVGLSGLAAACLPLRPKTMTLSDCVPALEETMQRNIARNSAVFAQLPLVRMLDWQDVADDAGERYETIIASDCVYMSTAPLFLRAVFNLLEEGGDLILTNPTEKGRPGIDKVIYALQERGDVQFETVVLTMEPKGYHKDILIIHMRNFVSANQDVAASHDDGDVPRALAEACASTAVSGRGAGGDGGDEGGGKGEHPDMFDESLVDEFAGLFEDSD